MNYIDTKKYKKSNKDNYNIVQIREKISDFFREVYYENFTFEIMFSPHYPSYIIRIKLLEYNNLTDYEYFDDEVREITSIIANELRDLFNKNMFFNLINGIFYFYI